MRTAGGTTHRLQLLLSGSHPLRALLEWIWRGLIFTCCLLQLRSPASFRTSFLSQTVKTVNFYTFSESWRMPGICRLFFSNATAYAEPQTCNLIWLKLWLNVIHFQICRFHKGSLLFPTISLPFWFIFPSYFKTTVANTSKFQTLFFSHLGF